MSAWARFVGLVVSQRFTTPQLGKSVNLKLIMRTCGYGSEAPKHLLKAASIKQTSLVPNRQAIRLGKFRQYDTIYPVTKVLQNLNQVH